MPRSQGSEARENHFCSSAHRCLAARPRTMPDGERDDEGICRPHSPTRRDDAVQDRRAPRTSKRWRPRLSMQGALKVVLRMRALRIPDRLLLCVIRVRRQQLQLREPRGLGADSSISPADKPPFSDFRRISSGWKAQSLCLARPKAHKILDRRTTRPLVLSVCCPKPVYRPLGDSENRNHPWAAAGSHRHRGHGAGIGAGGFVAHPSAPDREEGGPGSPSYSPDLSPGAMAKASFPFPVPESQ